MGKPSAAKIRAVVPLTNRAERGDDPLRFCNVCGREVDPSDLPTSVWREHDERDKPLAGAGALVFVGTGRDHAACQKELEEHPRLYAEEGGAPGCFPRICGPCVHRRGIACMHQDLRANGGAGLAITLEGLGGIVCSRKHGCWSPPRHAIKCAGRRILKLVADEEPAS